MALDPGAVDNSGNFINSDCMAKDIYDAMSTLMPLPQISPDLQDEIERKQRLLAIAFSTGIINYLKAHAGDSFAITVTTSATGDTATLTIL